MKKDVNLYLTFIASAIACFSWINFFDDNPGKGIYFMLVAIFSLLLKD